MKHSLTLTVLVTPGTEALLEIFSVLHRFGRLPESLLWSVIPGSGEARAWLLIDAPADDVELLRVHLGRITAVRRVGMNGSGSPFAPADRPGVQ